MGEFSRSLETGIGFGEAEQLVLRLKARDESAFAEVFTLYRDMVYTVASKLLADKSEALDVTQEVFVILYRKVHQFRGDCSLKTWLYRVALNQAANRNRWWKRRRLDRTVSLSIISDPGERSKPPEPVNPEAGPDDAAVRKELRKKLEEGLQQLPFDQKSAVVLRDVEGLCYEEIAEILGIQVGTVKSRISRGRQKLRGLLRPYRNKGSANGL